MKNIIISTTAINRPKLHLKVFEDWYKLINSLNCKITHFINIDCIDKLPYSYEDTVKNFHSIGNKYNINLQILQNKTPNFFLSCLNLSKQIDLYIEFNNINKENIFIFWLEDDWILTRDMELKKYMNYLNNDSKLTFESHINYSIIVKNYLWALSPCILGYNIFKEMLNIWTHHYITDNIKDPENCIGKAYLKKKYQTNSNALMILDDTLDKLNLNESHFSNYFKYKNRFILDQKLLTKWKNKINLDDFKSDIFNIIILPNSTMDVGREYMEQYNIKKKKMKDKQFVYIKIE